MTRDDHLTYDGITQPVSEWALDYGIPAELILERLAKGQTAEAAITTMMPFDPAPSQRGPRAARLYAHDGQTLTVAEWSERSGVPRSTVTQRLRRGMSIEQAINRDLNRKNDTYAHNGEEKTLREWADHAGLSYGTLRYRVTNLGMSVADALSMRKHTKPGLPKPKQQPRRSTHARASTVTIIVGDVRIEITGRGVVSNLAPFLRTGDQSSSQESTNIQISGISE